MNFRVEYDRDTAPIKIKDETIEHCESAEHVGMVRNTEGNLPTILTRIYLCP